MAAEAIAEIGREGGCELCGSAATHCVADSLRDQEYGSPGSWRWLRCDDCGLIRLDPRPSDAELFAAYPADYHAYVEPGSALTRFLQRLNDRVAARSLSALLPAQGVVLDVGCGPGRLLAALGAGGSHRLLGVETDERAAAAARGRGVEVFVGELCDAPFASGSVDLVVLRHVLEHVRDPVATLRAAFAVLRPGGLVLGEVPNHRSFDAWLFGKHWGGAHAPRHLFHFTPQSLAQLLGAAGFEAPQISPALHTGHWALSIQNWLRRGRADTRGLRSGRAVYYPALLLATLPINLLQLAGTHTGIVRFRASRPA